MTATAITLAEFMQRVTNLQAKLEAEVRGTDRFAQSGASICSRNVFRKALAAEEIDWSILTPELKTLLSDPDEVSPDTRGSFERETNLSELEAEDIDPDAPSHVDALLKIVPYILDHREQRARQR